jgi:aminoglycoside/choline kinase family phosphotransferase
MEFAVADRMSQISQFLRQTVAADYISITPLSGDASFRRYWRVNSQSQQWVLMDAPPVAADLQRFISTAQAFAQAGLRVPAVLACQLQEGLLLLEDLGDALLQCHLNEHNAIEQYRKAIALIPAIQQISATDSGPLPLFDDAFVRRELTIFTEWCWQTHLQQPLTDDIAVLLDNTFSKISSVVRSQPQAGMHRDFHSRNLMLLPDQQLAVIDFQDAVVGPFTYDLVSLLRDCYLRWPDPVVEQLLAETYHLWLAQGHIPAFVTLAEFRRYFDWTGLQRHIKVLGIFCRLYHRDQKAGYLADLPRVAHYVADISALYPELAGFHRWFASTVLPALVKSA